MGFNNLLKLVENSPIFKDFISNHPKAELCAGFFVLDFVGNDNKQTLDYKISKNVFTFSISENDEIIMAEDKLIEQEGTPELATIKKKVIFELEDLKSVVGIRMLDEGIHSKLQKIIAVLQNTDGKTVWNLTCMLEGLQILHVLIDADSEKGEIVKFEKKSMMDFIKKEK